MGKFAWECSCFKFSSQMLIKFSSQTHVSIYKSINGFKLYLRKLGNDQRCIYLWSLQITLGNFRYFRLCTNPPKIFWITNHLGGESWTSMYYTVHTYFSDTRVTEVEGARERRSPKGQGLLRKEGPPTYAILSRNLVWKAFTGLSTKSILLP